MFCIKEIGCFLFSLALLGVVSSERSGGGLGDELGDGGVGEGGGREFSVLLSSEP